MTRDRPVEPPYPEPPPLAARTVALMQSAVARGVPLMIPGAYEVRRSALAVTPSALAVSPHARDVAAMSSQVSQPNSTAASHQPADEQPSPGLMGWLRRAFGALA